MSHTERVPWGGGGRRGAAGRPPLGSGPPASATSAPALGALAAGSAVPDMGSVKAGRGSRLARHFGSQRQGFYGFA